MTTMKVTAKQRQQAKVTHGTCQIKATNGKPLPVALDTGDVLLTIATDRGVTNYTVLRISGGFRITKLTPYIVDQKVYDIDITQSYGWKCDCPDAEFQSRECKHVHALRAALVRHGIVAARSLPADF